MVSDGISRDSASNSTCYFSVGVFWVNGVQLVGFSRLCALVVSQSAVPYLGNPLGTGLLCLGAFIFWVVGGVAVSTPSAVSSTVTIGMRWDTLG